jgi:hypothetical protein
MMNNLMNDPGNEASNEAERQWWCIEFEFSAQNPDGKIVWATFDHTSRDCPDCQRIQSHSLVQCSAQLQQQRQSHNQPKDTDSENG